ncbi:MAG: AAA family ATPase [Planctomycetota bacterium]
MTEVSDGQELEARAVELVQKVQRLREEVAKVFVGHQNLVEQLLWAVLAGGHVLLEGLPGLGKTMLVNSLARCMGLSFSRIQFTPDLMPADITGTRIIEEHDGHRQFRFQKGPLFANLVLADEINRATPKTQSALLEAMQEGSVTVGRDSHQLAQPFNVIATQNPIELEGTYPLPEAQLDRFLFKLLIDMPNEDDLVEILDSTTGAALPELATAMSGEEVVEFQALARQVLCGEHLLRWVAALVKATHPHEGGDETTRRFVRYGASPRAGQAMVLAAKVRALLQARPCVAREDLQAALVPALGHRLVLSFEAESEGIGVPGLLAGWRRQADAAV